VTERITFDYRKLRGRIVEVYGTGKAFAEANKIGRAWLSKKLADGSSLRQEEMMMFAKALDIPETEYSDYFFTPKV
jgi:hypothetical protein